MNTLNPKFVNFDKKPETITVRAMRLESLLDKYLPKGISIDFLTVDVEGLDLEVLQSNDWSRYRPEIVVVEHHETFIQNVLNSDIYKSMVGWGYELHGWAKPSLIFQRRDLNWSGSGNRTQRNPSTAG